MVSRSGGEQFGLNRRIRCSRYRHQQHMAALEVCGHGIRDDRKCGPPISDPCAGHRHCDRRHRTSSRSPEDNRAPWRPDFHRHRGRAGDRQRRAQNPSLLMPARPEAAAPGPCPEARQSGGQHLPAPDCPRRNEQLRHAPPGIYGLFLHHAPGRLPVANLLAIRARDYACLRRSGTEMKNILLTGASGFVGRQVARSLLARGHRLRPGAAGRIGAQRALSPTRSRWWRPRICLPSRRSGGRGRWRASMRSSMPPGMSSPGSISIPPQYGLRQVALSGRGRAQGRHWPIHRHRHLFRISIAGYPYRRR